MHAQLNAYSLCFQEDGRILLIVSLKLILYYITLCIACYSPYNLWEQIGYIQVEFACRLGQDELNNHDQKIL